MPGAVNKVADALSPYIGTIEDTDIDQYEETSRCHDNAMNDSIRVAQRTDTFCKPIIYYLESGDPNTLPNLPLGYQSHYRSLSSMTGYLCATLT